MKHRGNNLSFLCKSGNNFPKHRMEMCNWLHLQPGSGIEIRTRYIPKKKNWREKSFVFVSKKKEKCLAKLSQEFETFTQLEKSFRFLLFFCFFWKETGGAEKKKSWSVKLFQCGSNYSWWVFFFSRRRKKKWYLDRSTMSFKFPSRFVFDKGKPGEVSARKFNKMLEESYLP